MCPSSGADDCVMFSPCVGIVPWLQEGCQDRLAGSASTEEFVTLRAILHFSSNSCSTCFGQPCAHLVLRTPQWTHYLLTGSDSLPAATAQYQHMAITLRSRQLLEMGTLLPETC